MNARLTNSLNSFKRIIAMLLVSVMLVPFFACNNSLTPKPSPTVEVTLDPMPYKSDGLEYAYIMTDERDLKWEEDVVFFADSFLNPEYGHPRLVDIECPTFIYSRSAKHSDEIRSYISYYDAEFRETFLRRINEIILSIPKKSDMELTMALLQTVPCS